MSVLFLQELELMPVLDHCPHQCPSITACKEHSFRAVPLDTRHNSCPMLALFPRPVTVSKLCEWEWTILSKCQGKHWRLMYLCHLIKGQVCLELGETMFPKNYPFPYQIGVNYLPPVPREQQAPDVTFPPFREAAGTFLTCQNISF